MPTARSHTGYAVLFAALCALAFGLAAWLYAVRMDSILSEVEASRVRFTLADLGADFEKGLDRGYDLPRLANAQAALEAEARQDSDILSLAVLDAHGRQVFHTGEPAGSANMPGQSGPFRREADGIVASAALTYNYGAPAGTLLMRYSNRPHDEIMAALRLRLGLAALAATLLSTLALSACLRRLERRRLALGAQLELALEAVRTPAGTDPELADMVDNVNQTAATALVELTAARHALRASEATP